MLSIAIPHWTTWAIYARWSRGFTVWGAGRDGRAFANELCALDARYAAGPARIAAMCDVDEAKLARGEYHNAATGLRLPVVPWRDAAPPVVCCVALGRTDGAFEANVASWAAARGLREGRDYYFFN